MADTEGIQVQVHVTEAWNGNLEAFKDLQCKELSQGLDMNQH